MSPSELLLSLLSGLAAASVKGTVVALLVGLAVALVGERLSPAVRGALWTLVLLRLALPWTPAGPWSLFGALPAMGGPTGPGGEPLWAGGLPTGAGFAEAMGRAGGSPGGSGAFGAGWGGVLLVVLALLWLAGALRMAGRWARAHRTQLRLLKGARPVTEPWALDLLETCRGELSWVRPVELLETEALGEPAVRGVLRPQILLPAAMLRSPDASLRHVLLHELAHVRRLDGPVVALGEIVRALHWFNPAVHWALARLAVERELAADRLALSRLDPRERVGYGRTLLRLAVPDPGSVSGSSVSPPLLAFGWSRAAGLDGSTNPRDLKRRLAMITRYRRAPLWRRFAWTGLVLAVGAAALTDLPTASPEAAPEPAREAAAQGAPSEEMAADMAAQKRTVERVRTLGVALYHWADRQDGAEDGEISLGEGEVPKGAWEWSDCPRVSAERLEELLVPGVVAELPATEDGWGHPLEVCLDEDLARTHGVVGVRSPGRDGTFQGTLVRVGAFPFEAMDRDLVWMDGYFLTWPTAEGSGDR